MALMKTGRRGVEPTKKGEDPKKKNGVEPSQKQYTWEDVAKNEEIKSRNKAAREKYQSDIESYGQSMKKYTGEAVPTASSEELSMINAAGSKVRGSKSTFTGNKDLFSAAKENEDYEKSIKSGKYVDIDDPRIDAKTRYYLKGAAMGLGSGSDVLGKRTGKVAVPIEKALGKEKPTKWGDIYGGKDFDPYEFDKAAKSGNIESYMSKKGISFADMNMTDIKAKTQYEAPKKPYEPTYEKEQNIDARKLPIDKLPINQAKLAKGKLATGKATSAEVEKQDWEGPAGGTKYRTKYKVPYISTTNKAKSLGRFVKAKVEAIGKPKTLTPSLIKEQGKARLIQGKTGREEQMAKAYFGGGFGNQPLSTIRERQDVLKAGKAETKAGIKEARKEGNREKVAAYRAVKKDYNAEMKQAKLAGKYLKAYDREAQGVNVNTDVNKYGGKIKTFTGQAMAGFAGSKQDVFNKYASSEKYIRKSTDNPANKNTIANQEKSLSFKEKVQASKQNRQNAPSFSERRQQKKIDKELIRNANKKASQIGQ